MLDHAMRYKQNRRLSDALDTELWGDNVNDT